MNRGQTVDEGGVSSVPFSNHLWFETLMSKFVPAIAVLSLILLSSSANAQVRQQAQRPGLFSETSIEKGWKRSMHQKQPMLVMFTSDNCKFCKKMLAETYGHPTIEQMLATNTQTVLAHKNDYEALVKKLGIRGYPSSVLISPKGDVLEFVEGFLPPKEFAARVVPVLQKQARTNHLTQQQASVR